MICRCNYSCTFRGVSNCVAPCACYCIRDALRLRKRFLSYILKAFYPCRSLWVPLCTESFMSSLLWALNVLILATVGDIATIQYTSVEIIKQCTSGASTESSSCTPTTFHPVPKPELWTTSANVLVVPLSSRQIPARLLQ